jgi:hypothetical protein
MVSAVEEIAAICVSTENIDFIAARYSMGSADAYPVGQKKTPPGISGRGEQPRLMRKRICGAVGREGG